MRLPQLLSVDITESRWTASNCLIRYLNPKIGTKFWSISILFSHSVNKKSKMIKEIVHERSSTIMMCWASRAGPRFEFQQHPAKTFSYEYTLYLNNYLENSSFSYYEFTEKILVAIGIQTGDKGLSKDRPIASRECNRGSTKNKFSVNIFLRSREGLPNFDCWSLSLPQQIHPLWMKSRQ